jgi:hypothetical protein
MKAVVLVLLRIVILAGLYFICFSIVSAVLIPRTSQNSSTGNEATLVLSLLVVSFLNASVLSYVILRSRLAGWKLALSAFVIFFGATTFMSQMETAVFVTSLPPGMLPRIVLSGLVVALIFCPLAVLILGKRKGDETSDPTSRLHMPPSQWLLRLSLIAFCYVIIYFTFGYFIAWKNPAVRAYYQGNDPGDFVTQIKSVFRNSPWLPPFQFLRGLLWTGLALPVIRTMKGHWLEAALAIGLCFAVFMSALLLIPNPIMPSEVRMAHLLETASSNFLYGWLVVLLLVGWRTTSVVHPLTTLL